MKKDNFSDIAYEIVYLVVAFLLQGSIVGFAAIGPVRPDLLLGSVTYIALRKGPFHATVAGFLVGLFQDLSFGGGLGLNSFCKSVIGFAAGRVSSGLYKERYWTQVVVITCSVVVHDLIYFAILHPGNIRELAFSILRVSIGSAVYTALVCSGYDYLMQRIFSRKETVVRETPVVPPEQQAF
ncbi:MAG: rod shape-determining protein MreD [Candidatus Eisenbacteria bacterium]|nr:rod shape-determining protein MreD [Candidatus Eisenbacteria bacterium]